jgi:hypothetical protein
MVDHSTAILSPFLTQIINHHSLQLMYQLLGYYYLLMIKYFQMGVVKYADYVMIAGTHQTIIIHEIKQHLLFS